MATPPEPCHRHPSPRPVLGLLRSADGPQYPPCQPLSHVREYRYHEPRPLHTHLLRFLFGHVGLFCLVAGFAIIGAFLYIQIELPVEEQRYALKRVSAENIKDTFNYMSSFFWHYQSKNTTFKQWDNNFKIHLKTMEKFIINAVDNFKYDGTVDDWDYDWVFPKALLFTITIMTTIGYGHIAPATVTGKMLTIGYAMVGTPMLLIFLANLGDSMATAFTLVYSRVCCRWCRSRRYQTEAGFGKKVQRLFNDKVGQEPYMPTDLIMVPITITMLLLTFYLIMGAFIFSNWEGWDFASAYYFSFVTLSTIGFGDLVPGNSFLDYKRSTIAAFKMIVTMLYCLCGMALISMCIQMMQDQIMSKVRWFAVEVGVIDSERRAERVKYKRSRKGAVPETPVDADGNRMPSAAGDKQRKKRRKKKQQERQAPTEEDDGRRTAAGSPLPAAIVRAESTDRLIDEEMCQA